jgi:hypothetical protein
MILSINLELNMSIWIEIKDLNCLESSAIILIVNWNKINVYTCELLLSISIAVKILNWFFMLS